MMIASKPPAACIPTGADNIPNSPTHGGLAGGATISFGNIPIRSGQQADMRFRADMAGNAVAIAIFAPGGSRALFDYCGMNMTCIRVTIGGDPALYAPWATTCSTNPNGCYQAGNGGNLVMRLYADDGTTNHLPTGSPLTEVTVLNWVTTMGFRSTFPRLHFPNCVGIVSGQYYHITFLNTAANTTTNWYSVDNFYGGDAVSRSAANLNAQNASNFTTLTRPNATSPWAIASIRYPIFTMGFTTGAWLGVGMLGTTNEDGT